MRGGQYRHPPPEAGNLPRDNRQDFCAVAVYYHAATVPFSSGVFLSSGGVLVTIIFPWSVMLVVSGR